MGMLKKKRKGFLLLQMALAMIVIGLLSVSLFTICSGQFSMIQASRTALQAQQYAEVDTNVLQLVDYDDIDDYVHVRQAIDVSKIITADGWEDEISITAETVVDVAQNTRQRIATVKIYKTGDTLARYSVEVPLSTKGRGGVPSGTILPWHGNITSIPSGFVLCDGSNSTPDLRGRAVIGSGIYSDIYGTTAYYPGNIGGERYHKLTIAEMPSHSHSTKIGDGYQGTGWVDQSGESYWGYVDGFIGTTGGDQPHNIMQPYYVLHYIMKV